MQESSKEFLLAEFDRLKTIQLHHIEKRHDSQQFYLAVISAATGIAFFLYESNPTTNTLRSSIVITLSVVLLIGMVTFLRAVSLDYWTVLVSSRYRKIRDEFVKMDAGLLDVFPGTPSQFANHLSSWSSLIGIVDRAISFSGSKTILSLLNCIVSILISILVFWPRTFWQGLAISGAVFILVSSIHAIYGSWRYRNLIKRAARAEVDWWM